MTVLFRCRVDPEKLDKASKITSELGTSMPELFRIFVSQIVRTGKVPVSLEIQADDSLTGSWAERGKVLESFYDKSKTW
jgi:antitoxin component of RelBE/YafQ-DinJ toxin-antitoxin module